MSTQACQVSSEAKRTAAVPAATPDHEREPWHQARRPAVEPELRAAIARRGALTRAASGSNGAHEVEQVGARRARAARNPEDVENGVERQTVNGDAGAPAPAASCTVASGPSYSPTGTIPLTTLGNGNKRARFSLAATFSGSTTRCCEVRQYIRWDKRFHDKAGGPPHSGFPSSATYDTWYEDRDTSDKRYGHRSGSYSDPRPRCGDEYLNAAGTRDQANGGSYCGKDGPEGFSTDVGQWQFQLKVVDTCNSDSVKTSSSVITVRWG